MEQIITRDQVVARLEKVHAEWEALLARVPPERIEQPGVEGQWSVKDVIAHVAHYERWIADVIERLMRGEDFTRSEMERMEIDARNALIYEFNRTRSLEDIREEAREASQRVAALVQRLKDSDLAPDSRLGRKVQEIWGEDALLVEVIGGDSFDHYDDHIAPLRAWLAQQGVSA